MARIYPEVTQPYTVFELAQCLCYLIRKVVLVFILVQDGELRKSGHLCQQLQTTTG